MEKEEKKNLMEVTADRLYGTLNDHAENIVRDLGYKNMEEFHEKKEYMLDIDTNLVEKDGEVYEEVIYRIYKKDSERTVKTSLTITTESSEQEK